MTKQTTAGLPTGGSFLKMRGMADPTTPTTTPAAPQWDEDAVYLMICHPTRRRILAMLAAGKPMTADALNIHPKHKLARTRKHLETLRASGIVGMTARDQTDGRRWLYHLLPSIRVTVIPTGKILDFGFCVLRVG
jgi:hypothetical protein